VPLKKIGYDDNKVKNWDSKGQKIRRAIQKIPLGREYVVSTSDEYAKIYESAFRRPASHIFISGQPRNDVFFDKDNYFQTKHAMKKAAKGRKIILYTPTHRREGEIPFPLEEQFDFRQLDAWCQKENADFVIKRHFYHKKDRVDLSMHKNIVDITNKSMDTQELLMDADILITDYSSTYIDYLLLDRPVIFYNFDYEDYLSQDREMYYPYEEVTPGFKAETFQQLMEELTRVMEGKDHFEQEREDVRNLFYCKEGQGPVGEKIIERIQKK
jgi:CDP-glycerol glycerophosphotransferase (TagB/SpsB family)